MSFDTELAKKQFKSNIVIEIDGDFYSEYQVDADSGDLMGTGSGVPANHVGLVYAARINPITFDIKKVNSTTQTLTFELLDKDGLISSELGASTTAFLEKKAKCYVGFITGSFDFSDYKMMAETTIKTITKRQNLYQFDATEVVSLLDNPIIQTQNTLNGSITNVSTTLTLVDATAFPSSGMVKIENEYIVYTGKLGNQLTGLARGDLSSTAASHADQETVYLVFQSGAINPITLMLQLMISPGGGGSYDVLDDGLGIDQTKIDVAEFESIRDTSFSGVQYRFYLENVGSAIDFFQNEILLPTRTRIFPKNGKISISELDQITIGGATEVIDEDTTLSLPQWRLNSDKVINKVVVNHGYSEGENKFSRQTVVEDADSIASYGAREALVFNFKGIKNDLSGGSIATNIANRVLSRLASPLGEIGVSTQFDKANINIGENVNLVHRYLPQQGGGLGLNAQLEVVSRAVDLTAGKADLKLAYTSYANLRIGLIAPSSNLTGITNQSVFTVALSEAPCWLAGYKVVLYNRVTNAFLPDPVNEIASVVGNTITMVNAWTTTLSTDFVLRFAPYDQATSSQTALYAFAGFNSGFFTDGTKSYQIIF